MVGAVKKALLVAAVVAAAVATLSKERVCNGALALLADRGIKVCVTQSQAGMLACRMQKVAIEYADNEAASIQRAVVDPLRFEAFGIVPKGALAALWPYKIKRVRFDFWRGTFAAEGAFGTARGAVDWLNRRIKLELRPSRALRQSGLLKGVAKFQNGKYIYDGPF